MFDLICLLGLVCGSALTFTLATRPGPVAIAVPFAAQLALMVFAVLCFLAARSIGLRALPSAAVLLGIGLIGLVSAARAPSSFTGALLSVSDLLLRAPWLIFGVLSGIVISNYAPTLWQKPRLLTAAWWVALGGGVATEVGAILWLIWAKPRQFPFSDEFSTVRWLMLEREGRFGWHTLWEFYFAHRLVLMKPTHLLLIEWTNWNEQLLLTLNLVVAALTILCLCGLIAPTIVWRPLRRIALLVVILWTFALSQYEHFMTSFGFQYLLAIAGFAFGLWALCTRSRREGFALGVVGAIIASLASFEGLASWVCLAPLVARRGVRWLLPWLGVALAIIVPYSLGFPFGIAKGSVGIAHVIPFVLAALGAPLGTINDLHAELIWMGDPVGEIAPLRAQLFAIASVAAVALSLLVTWRRTRTLANHLGWLCLMSFAAASACATALARPLDEALTSRHQNFSILWWIGACCCVLVALDATRGLTPGRPIRRAHPLALRIILLCAFVVAACFAEVGVNTFIIAQRWQEEFARKNACIFAYATTPDSCINSANAAFVRLKLAYLAREQLMIFAGHPEAKPPAIRADPGTAPALSTLRALEMQPYAKFAALHDPFPGNSVVAEVYPPLVVSAQQPYSLSGWAIDPTAFAPAAGIFVAIDGGEPIWARCGEVAPWPADNFGAALRESGFQVTLPAAALTPGLHELRIVVVNAAMTGYFNEQRFTITAR